MSKPNARLFKMLRERVTTKLGPTRLSWGERSRLQSEARMAIAKKLTKERLINIVVYARRASEFDAIEIPHEQDDHKEQRQQLLNDIDSAELRSLAGDSDAAIKLIARIEAALSR